MAYGCSSDSRLAPSLQLPESTRVYEWIWKVQPHLSLCESETCNTRVTWEPVSMAESQASDLPKFSLICCLGVHSLWLRPLTLSLL